jgi:hypothetical protein
MLLLILLHALYPACLIALCSCSVSLSDRDKVGAWVLGLCCRPFWTLLGPARPSQVFQLCCRADLLRCFLLWQGCFASDMDWAGSRAHRFRDAPAPPPPPPAALNRLTIHRDICTPRAANRPPPPPAMHRPPHPPRLECRFELCRTAPATI